MVRALTRLVIVGRASSAPYDNRTTTAAWTAAATSLPPCT